MKGIILFVFCFCLLHQRAYPQAYMDIGAINTYTNPHAVSGFHLGVLGRSHSITDKKHTLRPGIQYGGGISAFGLCNRTFEDIPMANSQKGLAKVDIYNRLYALKAMMRFNLHSKSIFTPHLDAFVGYGLLKSILRVNPYLKSYGNIEQKENKQEVFSAHGLNCGVGFGILTRITRRLYFELGVSYSAFLSPQKILDPGTAYVNEKGLYLDLVNAPGRIVCAQAGLVFYLKHGVKSTISGGERKRDNKPIVLKGSASSSSIPCNRKTTNLLNDYYYNGVYRGSVRSGYRNGGTHVGAGRTGSTNTGNGGGGINSQSWGGAGNTGGSIKGTVQVYIRRK